MKWLSGRVLGETRVKKNAHHRGGGHLISRQLKYLLGFDCCFAAGSAKFCAPLPVLAQVVLKAPY